MKIALAGRKDSTHISHFGRADFFRIYDQFQGRYILREIRFNEPPCNGLEHDPERLAQAVALIEDCAAVVASDIGPGAQRLLIKLRIYPFEREGEGPIGIELALQSVHTRLAKSRPRTIAQSVGHLTDQEP